MRGGLHIWQPLMLGGYLTLLIRVSTLFTILPIKFGDNLGWIRTYLMISLPFKSLLLFSGYFYTPVLLSVGASTSRQSQFWVHRKRAFALLRCTGIGKLWWLLLRKSYWVAVGFLSFLLRISCHYFCQPRVVASYQVRGSICLEIEQICHIWVVGERERVVSICWWASYRLDDEGEGGEPSYAYKEGLSVSDRWA